MKKGYKKFTNNKNLDPCTNHYNVVIKSQAFYVLLQTGCKSGVYGEKIKKNSHKNLEETRTEITYSFC